MGKVIARGFLVVLGVSSLINAALVWFALDRIGVTLGTPAPTPLAESTLRGDLGALFGMFGVLSIAAAIRDDRRLLLAPMLLPALAIAGRLVSYALAPAPAAVPLIAVEAVALAGVVIARAGLAKNSG
ncbi:MAG: hypothetical protein C0476_09630 [Sphingomonas sp.]|nr:hypothetical protein [Sphingomonas sp.]